MAGKIAASKLINLFWVIQQHLVSGLLHHQITSLWIQPIGRCIRVFLIFRWAFLWLLMPLLIWSSLCLIAEQLLLIWLPLHNSDGGVIPFQEVLELLTKIHDILDITVSKWVGKTAYIIASHFNSAFSQHHEVWALQYPFLHKFKDSGPPSEACHYGCVNWSVAQPQWQSSLDLSLYSTSLRDGRTRLRFGFQFNAPKQLVAESAGGSVAKRPHSSTRMESCQHGRKSSGGGASASITDS